MNLAPNPINSHFVPWRELIPAFCKLFPRAISDAINSGKINPVQYAGVTFEIRPIVGAATESKDLADDFTVYGPPFINIFPDSPLTNHSF